MIVISPHSAGERPLFSIKDLVKHLVLFCALEQRRGSKTSHRIFGKSDGEKYVDFIMNYRTSCTKQDRTLPAVGLARWKIIIFRNWGKFQQTAINPADTGIIPNYSQFSRGEFCLLCWVSVQPQIIWHLTGQNWSELSQLISISKCCPRGQRRDMEVWNNSMVLYPAITHQDIQPLGNQHCSGKRRLL